MGVGYFADITVYTDKPTAKPCSRSPNTSSRTANSSSGTSKIVKVVNGATHVARPSYDRSIEKSLKSYFDDYHTVRMENFRLSDDEIIDHGRGSIIVQPSGSPMV